MNRWIFQVLAILAVFSLCATGCENEGLPGVEQSAETQTHKAPLPEEHPPLMPPGNPQEVAPHSPAEEPPAHEMKVSPHSVVVPESVKGKWQAVTLAVTNASGETIDLEAPLGKTTAISGSSLTVEISAFLPSFFMDNKTITSVNNESKNPAAKVIVREGETVIHEGWLFKNYPDIHPFEKDGLKLMLLGGIKTEP